MIEKIVSKYCVEDEHGYTDEAVVRKVNEIIDVLNKKEREEKPQESGTMKLIPREEEVKILKEFQELCDKTEVCGEEGTKCPFEDAGSCVNMYFYNKGYNQALDDLVNALIKIATTDGAYEYVSVYDIENEVKRLKGVE